MYLNKGKERIMDSKNSQKEMAELIHSLAQSFQREEAVKVKWHHDLVTQMVEVLRDFPIRSTAELVDNYPSSLLNSILTEAQVEFLKIHPNQSQRALLKHAEAFLRLAGEPLILTSGDVCYNDRLLSVFNAYWDYLSDQGQSFSLIENSHYRHFWEPSTGSNHQWQLYLETCFNQVTGFISQKKLITRIQLLNQIVEKKG